MRRSKSRTHAMPERAMAALAACDLIMQHPLAGARWGCFTKEVDLTHVGTFAWFTSQRDLIENIDVWERYLYTEVPPSGTWKPPFLVSSKSVRKVGPLLMTRLREIAPSDIEIQWAGPVSELAFSTNGFWRGLRESFIDWGMEDDPPATMPKLTKDGLLPTKFFPRFRTWISKYIEC